MFIPVAPAHAWWLGQRIGDRACYGGPVEVILRHGVTKEPKVRVSAPREAVPVPERSGEDAPELRAA